MKKLLLICAFLIVGSTQAQDYWTEYSDTQPAVSTSVSSISVVDANNVWLNMQCGTSGCTKIRRYAKSADSGLTWSTAVIDLGASSANLQIANICGVSGTTAYASVFPSTAGTIGGVYQTTNSGATWTKQTTATYNDLNSFCDFVHFFNANNGVAFGDPDSAGYFEIYTTSNGGTNWTRVASTPVLVAVAADEFGLTNKFVATGNVIWAGTTYGRILKSTDMGLTWTSVDVSAICGDFGGAINGNTDGNLAFSDANNGLFMVTDTSAGTIVLYSTTDGGTTWNPVTSVTPPYSFDIAPIPGTPYYVSVGNTDPSDNTTPRGSSFTIDGGVNWININDNPDVNYVDGGQVRFFNNMVGFAGGFNTSSTVGGIFKWNGNDLLASNATFNDKTFSATPNPTSGNVTLRGATIDKVTVTDILGKVVSTSTYSSIENVSLDMTSFKTGVYFVKVSNNAGKQSTIKVIKE